MSDLPPEDPGVAALARTMAALMADPITRAPERRPVSLARRMAVVTAVDVGPPLRADVLLDQTTIPGASPQATYRPQVDDIVWLEMQGTDAHISPPLASVTNRQWATLAPAAGWSLVGGYFPPGYWRDPMGGVWLRGAVGGGANNSTVITLPDGFRPTGTAVFPAACVSGGGPVAATLSVSSAGVVVYGGPAAPTLVSLDGVHFRLD